MDLEFKCRPVCKEESQIVLKDEGPGARPPGHTAGTWWSQSLNSGIPLVLEGLVVSGLGMQRTEMGPLKVVVGSWNQRN